MNESGSSIPDLIKGQIDTVHSISEKGFKQSSIHECFRNQVDELLQLKEESISLKAQLKMAQETTRLQEAEYAFQRKQFEDEINSLKSKEQNLIDTVTKFQNDVVQTHKYDVQVILSQKDDQISQLSSKYKKWKDKCRSLSSEVEKAKSSSASFELQEKNNILSQKITAQTEEIEKLKQSISQISSSSFNERPSDVITSNNSEDHHNADSLSEQIHTLTKELSQSKQESKSIQNDLTSQLEQLKEEKNLLEKKLESANSKVIKQQVKIGQLSDENRSISSSSMEISSQVEQENQQLRSRAKSFQKQKHILKEQIKQLQSAIQHAELEQEQITDILGIESDDFHNHWGKMISKIEQLVKDSSSVNELKTQNDKLQKRLNAALDDSRKSSTNKQFSGKDGYVSTLQTNLKSARLELDQCKTILAQYKNRLTFNSAIENMNHHLINQINDLYCSISCTNDTSIRPLIFAIIMCKRFFKIAKSDGINDPSALQVFGETSNISIGQKVEFIRKDFTKLTQELLVVKQSLLESNQNLENILEERDIAQITLRSNSEEMKINREKMKFIKKRMLELQNELTSLVSPEIYNNVCERLKIVDKQNSSLLEKIKELEDELEQRTELERSMNERVEHLQVKADQSTEMAHKSREQYASKEEEIEALKSLLREKTKEILSLERLVHRQEEKETVMKNSFTCLAANQIVNVESSKVPNDGMSELKRAIKAEINPAFLGK